MKIVDHREKRGARVPAGDLHARDWFESLAGTVLQVRDLRCQAGDLEVSAWNPDDPHTTYSIDAEDEVMPLQVSYHIDGEGVAP